MLPTQVVSARRGKGVKGGGGNAISSLLRSRVPLWVVALAALQILLLCQLYGWLAAATPVAVPAAVNPAAAAAPHTAAAVAAASSSAVLSSEAAAVPPPTVGVAISYPTTGEPLEVRATGAFERRPPAFASHGPDGGIFFSIVVAAYNQGKFLEETMKSIFGQAYDRWEVIIVNDGSTDTTWEVTLQLLTFVDGTHEWGYNLPFDTTDGGWQLRTTYLDRPTKPISSLEVYCMLRGKAGTAYFADVVVAQASRSACACPEGQVYVPSSAMPCAPCPPGASACLLGEPLFDAQAL